MGMMNIDFMVVVTSQSKGRQLDEGKIVKMAIVISVG